MTGPISTERLELEGLPVLHVCASGLQGAAPTILFYHGWGSRKESHRITAESLTCEGFRVILPDAPRHGERGPIIDVSAPDAMEHYWEIAIPAIEEALRLKEAAVALGIADPGRIGVGGSSMGGMIASGVFARHDWVKAAAICNSSPTFDWMDDQARAALGAGKRAEEERAWLRGYDPEHLRDQIAPRPFLMLHGTADTVVSVECPRRFVELARPLYADSPERLVLDEYPRLNHWIPVGMVEAMRNWFLKYV